MPNKTATFYYTQKKTYHWHAAGYLVKLTTGECIRYKGNRSGPEIQPSLEIMTIASKNTMYVLNTRKTWKENLREKSKDVPRSRCNKTLKIETWLGRAKTAHTYNFVCPLLQNFTETLPQRLIWNQLTYCRLSICKHIYVYCDDEVSRGKCTRRQNKE